MAVKPGVSTLVFCRFNDDDASLDYSPADTNRSPWRSPQPPRPSLHPLPPTFPTEAFQLLGRYHDQNNPNLYTTRHTLPPRIPPPKDPTVSTNIPKRPSEPQHPHQFNPYTQYEEILRQITQKCNEHNNSDYQLAAKQAVMRFQQIKAAATLRNIFLKVYRSRQIRTLLKA